MEYYSCKHISFFMTHEQPALLNQNDSLNSNHIILTHRLEQAIHFVNADDMENPLSFSPLHTAQLREMDYEGLEVLINQLKSFCMMIRSDQEILMISEEGNLDIQLWHMCPEQAINSIQFIQACILTVQYVRNSKKSELVIDTQSPFDQQ